MNWKPHRIRRIVEVLHTSTRPFKVETDEGFALAKYCGNPQGLDALVSELLAAELLKRLDIEAPQHSVVWMDAFEMPEQGVVVQEGPAFLTEWQPTAITFSGSQELLKKLSNPETITEVLAFDTWIKNLDRFVSSPNSYSENLDNLLFVPDRSKVRMMIIDHSHAFTESTFDDGLPADWWADEDVCGTLPNFDAFVDEGVLHNTLDKMSTMHIEDLEDIVGIVPTEWQLSSSSKEKIANGLLNRAQRMQKWLPAALMSQPPLSFEMGKRV